MPGAVVTAGPAARVDDVTSDLARELLSSVLPDTPQPISRAVAARTAAREPSRWASDPLTWCADRRPSGGCSSPDGAEKGKEAVLVRSWSPSASGPLGPRPRLSARPLSTARGCAAQPHLSSATARPFRADARRGERDGCMTGSTVDDLRRFRLHGTADRLPRRPQVSFAGRRRPRHPASSGASLPSARSGSSLASASEVSSSSLRIGLAQAGAEPVSEAMSAASASR